MTIIQNLRLSDLKARIDEVGECWVWRGFMGGGKHPQWMLEGRSRPARRVIFELTHEGSAGTRQIGIRCNTIGCVHPEHLVARTRKQAMLVSTPKSAAGRANIAAGKRARGSKINLDIARLVRASDEPGTVLDARYGLSRGYCSVIRAGRSWPEPLGPFAGLGAR